MSELQRLATLGDVRIDPGSGKQMSVAGFFDVFADCGIDGYVCGGSVRDLLLGKPFNDIDFTFNAHVRDLRTVVEQVFGHHVVQYYDPGFGLLKIGPSLAQAIDITMYRSANSIGAASTLAELALELGPSLAEDARFRDLSINCLYWNTRDGLQDPLGFGADDVRARRQRIASDERKARIDPRLSLRSALFIARGFCPVPETQAYLAARLDVDLATYSQDKLDTYIDQLTHGSQPIATRLFDECRVYLKDDRARERLGRACTLPLRQGRRWA